MAIHKLTRMNPTRLDSTNKRRESSPYVMYTQNNSSAILVLKLRIATITSLARHVFS